MHRHDTALVGTVKDAGLPFASTLLGLGAMPTRHPLYVGLLGMHGNYGPNVKTNECDLLVAIGMRFDDRVTGDLAKYARQATVIHVDIDASEIDKNVPVDVGIVADAKEALAAMAERVATASHDDWLAEFGQCIDEMLASESSFLLDVIVEREENVFPMLLRLIAVLGRHRVEIVSLSCINPAGSTVYEHELVVRAEADHIRRAVKHMGACVGVERIDYRIEDATT